MLFLRYLAFFPIKEFLGEVFLLSVIFVRGKWIEAIVINQFSFYLQESHLDTSNLATALSQLLKLRGHTVQTQMRSGWVGECRFYSTDKMGEMRKSSHTGVSQGSSKTIMANN